LRALRRILALALALGCVAGPAQGDSAPSSIAGIDGVLYNDCLSYPYHYALDVPADAEEWTLEVTTFGPAGQQAETDSVSNEAPDGTGSFFLCTRPDGFGTYLIRSTFHWWDADATRHDVALADSSFVLRKPFTRTGVTSSTRRPRHGQLVRYRVSTLDERPAGFAPNAFAWVHLQKRSHGHWVRMKGGRGMTHDNGRVTLRLRYTAHRKRLLVRAVTEPSARYAGSTSPALRIW
jgi:hypothetical protein